MCICEKQEISFYQYDNDGRKILSCKRVYSFTHFRRRDIYVFFPSRESLRKKDDRRENVATVILFWFGNQQVDR